MRFGVAEKEIVIDFFICLPWGGMYLLFILQSKDVNLSLYASFISLISTTITHSLNRQKAPEIVGVYVAQVNKSLCYLIQLATSPRPSLLVPLNAWFIGTSLTVPFSWLSFFCGNFKIYWTSLWWNDMLLTLSDPVSFRPADRCRIIGNFPNHRTPHTKPYESFRKFHWDNSIS